LQFVPKGPDVPDSLVQAHEDGRVVFFCGAGISYPAGLPGFGSLVWKMYENLGVVPDGVQAEVLKNSQYDKAVTLLERQHPGGRFASRRALRQILNPDLNRLGALETHQALIALASSKARLITTNFDRLFEECTLTGARFAAPLLPVPKSQWKGLVYLHGLLPPNEDSLEFDLNKLVLSSWDFGRAYLTERWAARFVSDLFRNYVVCFVGYSLDDPILRYMMDALAADRLLGESAIDAYAFGGTTTAKYRESLDQWQAKGVIPILYRTPTKADHSYLHKTLQAWSTTYRDGVLGKEALITQYAPLKPARSTVQDNYVGRVFWALSERLGLAAKKFADLKPPPPFEWLEVFCENRYHREDLSRFGITPNAEAPQALQFSFESKPTPYWLAPRMSLLHRGTGEWDKVMGHIARWLFSYLDDPRLFLWVATRGGELHPTFAEQLKRHLQATRIKPTAAVFWQLLLAGRVRARTANSTEIYGWIFRFRDAKRLSLAMRLSLRELLSPKITVRPAYDYERLFGKKAPKTKKSKEPDFVNWDIALGSEHIYHALKELAGNEDWARVLPELMSDFTALLKDVLDLMSELGGASRQFDLSYVRQPSIAKHEQNNEFTDWTALINLLRDGWERALRDNPARAIQEASRWDNIDYPLFRRMVFYVMAVSELYSPAQQVDRLLADDRFWFWTVETTREVKVLIRTKYSTYPAAQAEVLEKAILEGPPRSIYRTDLEQDVLKRAMEIAVLEKLQLLGTRLSEEGDARRQALQNKYPDFHPTEQRDFPVWMGPVTDIEAEVPSPWNRTDLARWVAEHAETQGGDWFSRCQRDIGRCLTTLLLLAKRGDWSAPIRWEQALQAWSTGAATKSSWRFLSETLAAAPKYFLEKIQEGLSWWLDAVARVLTTEYARFLSLISMSLDFERTKTSDPPTKAEDAFGQPAGRVVQALFNWWFRQGLEDGQGIGVEVRGILEEVADTRVANFAHARLILCANVVALYRLDAVWTEQHVLPLFDWDRSHAEALGAWQGFLWTPRLHPPLIAKIKSQLFATADHIDELGESLSQYSGFLTYAALEMSADLNIRELAKAVKKLTIPGLVNVLHTLKDALVSAADKREAHWENRISPFLRTVWPQNKQFAQDQNISNAIAELFLQTNTRFPQAMEFLDAWLGMVAYPYSLITDLKNAGLCRRFPRPALTFLTKIIGTATTGVSLSPEFGPCLDEIEEGEPALTIDQQMQHLRAIQRLP
jgi:hypothetical protein